MILFESAISSQRCTSFSTLLTEINQNWCSSTFRLRSNRHRAEANQDCIRLRKITPLAFCDVPLHLTFIYLPPRFHYKMNIFPAPSAILRMSSFEKLRFSLSSESMAIFYDPKALKCFLRWKANENEMNERERKKFNLWSVYHHRMLTLWIGMAKVNSFRLAWYSLRIHPSLHVHVTWKVVKVLTFPVNLSRARESRRHSRNPPMSTMLNKHEVNKRP